MTDNQLKQITDWLETISNTLNDIFELLKTRQ